jgi:hypothetical protein
MNGKRGANKGIKKRTVYSNGAAIAPPMRYGKRPPMEYNGGAL